MLPFFLDVIIRSNWRSVHLITTRYEVLWEPYQRYHAVSNIQYVSLPRGYTVVAFRLNDVSVPVVDWCFFGTDWLILLLKHWLTDNAVICSLGANHRPADTETHECIMKGDDGGDWWVVRQWRKQIVHTLCMCSEQARAWTQTRTWQHTAVTQLRTKNTSRWGHLIAGSVSRLSSLCDDRHLRCWWLSVTSGKYRTRSCKARVNNVKVWSERTSLQT